MTRITLNRMQRRATILAAMIRIHIQDTQTTGSIGNAYSNIPTNHISEFIFDAVVMEHVVLER